MLAQRRGVDVLFSVRFTPVIPLYGAPRQTALYFLKLLNFSFYFQPFEENGEKERVLEKELHTLNGEKNVVARGENSTWL